MHTTNPTLFVHSASRALGTATDYARNKKLVVEELSTVPPRFSSVKALFMDQNSRYDFKKIWIYLFLACTVILYPVSGLTSENNEDLWKALKTGSTFILLRHANAPGMGDPEYFNVEDCSTQRNLSDAGRKQAVAIGNLFREHGIEKARVFSSQWCRCLETATLLKFGSAEVLPHLNSFFQQYERRDLQTQNLKEWIGDQNLEQPIVLVTHQVNITSLTDVYPSSGELVILQRSKSGNISVLGSIKTD